MEKFLPEICTIQYGFPFDSAKFSISEGMPLIRIRDVVRGYSETFTTEDYKEEYVVNKDDLLIGMDGEFNIAKWGATPALLNQRVCRLLPTSEVDKNYLFYFMPSALKRIEEKTPFVTVKHLSAKELNKVRVPLLPLEAQHRIVSLLDKVSDLIAKRRAQMDKLDLLVKSRFVEMFGDIDTHITAEEACEVIVDCPHSTPKYIGKNKIYPAIRTSEIKNGQIDWTSMLYVDAEEYKQRTKRLVPLEGDIVYAREGTYGDCVILPKQHRFCLGQRTMLFRPNYNICTSEYLHQVLRSDVVKRQADESNAGSTVPHVNVADAKKFAFPLPSLEKQKEFSNFVERTDKSKLTIQQSLDKLEILKKALMQEYFGE